MHPSPPPSLAQLPRGRAGVVEAVDGEDAVARRLRDLGFLPGTRVVMVRRAPLGDPTVYELRGTRFCLRRSEAGRVRMRPGSEDGP